GFEPAHLTVLAPQASASTNSATSAIRTTRPLRSPAYFGGGLVGAPAGGVAGAVVGAVAGAVVGAVAGALAGAGAAPGTLSSRLCGALAPRRWLAMYARPKLVRKKQVANAAVSFEKNVEEPRAPNTVPEAPEPKPAPASAPLPRCRSTSPMITAD